MKAQLLIFTPLPPHSTGGLQSHAREFNEQMARRGVKITVFAPNHPYPAWEIIHNYPLPQFWRPLFWRQWRQLPHTTDTIVISRTRFFFSSLMAWHFSRTYGVPWVHIEHGSDFTHLHHGVWHTLARWYDKTIGAAVLRKATRVVANSQASANFVRRLSSRKDVEVIYRGVDMKVSTFAKAPTDKSGTLTIVYIGRLIHSKGVADLLKATTALGRPDIRCLIIGDGPQKRHLQKIAGRNVQFVGEKSFPETIRLLASCDIFVNPSYTEGLPTSVIEAALCGKAIIATNVGGTPEIVQDKVSALLVSPRNITKLTQALRCLIDQPDLRQRLGQGAFAQNKDRWGWEKNVEKYEKIFEDLLSLRKGKQLKTQYLFRLDDICPTMSWENFERLQKIFTVYNIKPILGIVPDNQDPKLIVSEPRADFWSRMREQEQQGWIIAQHGYQHRYVTNSSGLLGLRSRSEFSGLLYEEQYQKIAAGKKILKENLGRPATWWMVPAHSFDVITCRVLKDLGFTHITDGIALYPFKKYSLTWVPHQIWKPEAKLFGLWTIGLHLNSLTPERIKNIEQFIKQHQAQCQSPNLNPRQSILNEPFQWYWYAKFYTLRWLYVRNCGKN